jgi:hypothetical protein
MRAGMAISDSASGASRGAVASSCVGHARGWRGPVAVLLETESLMCPTSASANDLGVFSRAVAKRRFVRQPAIQNVTENRPQRMQANRPPLLGHD